MRRVLVTGFEPFDGEIVNPAWDVARRLDGWSCGEHVVAARLLPCAFGYRLAFIRSPASCSTARVSTGKPIQSFDVIC